MAAQLARGSSPRLRGTSPAHVKHFFLCRFIPAPAGNIYNRRLSELAQSVHPRACGEHTIRVSTVLALAGSSPRLRGTSGQRAHRSLQLRFIPAPAGNIVARSLPSPRCAVHPRACGEHVGERELGKIRFGSSPRLRGTSKKGTRCQHKSRFIPAPAGNIRYAFITRIQTPVHPRACGEHVAKI